MATATSIARWILDEASSGTTPTTVFDSQGVNDLTIDYSSGDAAWTNVTEGNGLDFTATVATTDTAIAELADIATNGDIGSSFANATELSCVVRATIDNGHNFGARVFAIGTSSGNTDFAIVAEATRLQIRWDQESGGDGGSIRYTLPTGITTIGVSIDTSQATDPLRVLVYYDGVVQSQVSVPDGIATNSALGSINSTNRSVSIGNRPSQNRNVDGKVYYAELFTGVLTPTQHSDAHTALASDNDFNWDATAISAALTGTVTAALNEADLVAGGDTIVLTLTGDTFVTGTTSEDGIAGGSDSDKTGANKWDALIKTDLDNTDVVLSGGDTIATITLPAYATYDTAETETITWTIPAASLTTSSSELVVVPTFTAIALIRSITDIDTDNSVQAGQTNITITTELLNASPSTQIATLNGKTITINSWSASAVNVDIPLHVDVEWGSTTNQLALTDDTGTVTLENVTLATATDWEKVVLTAFPNPDDTESYYEHVQVDIGFIPAVGDTFAFESSVGMTVDGETIPTIDPPNTVSGDYKVWDVSASAYTAVSGYTWTDGGATNELAAASTATASTTGLLSGNIRFSVLESASSATVTSTGDLRTSATLAAAATATATAAGTLFQEVTNFSSWLDTLPSNSATQKIQDFLLSKGMIGGITNMMYEYLKTKSSKNSNSERFQEWKDNGFN